MRCMGAIAEAPIRIVPDAGADINAILRRIGETSIAACAGGRGITRFYLTTGIRAFVRCTDVP